MSKFIVIVVFFLFILFDLNAQDSLGYNLTITDENGGSNVLLFGIHKNATHRIDYDLGERMLPEFAPPDGLFSVLFIRDSVVDSTYWSYVDFRPLGSEQIFVRYYRFKMFNLITAYTLEWPELGERVDSAFILDIINGQIVKYDMKLNNSFHNENIGQDEFNIVVYYNDIVGVDEDVVFSSNELIRIAPNPVFNDLVLDCATEFNDYKIIDVHGSVVSKGNLESGRNALNIGKYPAGIYFLLANDRKGKVETKQIVKY